MRIELHCHSIHSDGSERPENVAARAARRGVELFCLTDHDSCGGYSATVGMCPVVLRGLELSCSAHDRSVHILCYDAARDDGRWSRLEDRLVELREARKKRLHAIAEKLAQLGVPIDIDPIIAASGGRSVGRPDLAQALVDQGRVATLDEAYRRYLGDGGAAYVGLSRLTVAEGLVLGRDAGAVMALAHPHTLGDLATTLVRRHRADGLDGLECYYGMYNSRQRRRWLNLANNLDMTITGGSDFHGDSTPQIAEPGIDLPDRYDDQLRAWLGL
ncbi:MAG: PHP domain-containing protein [Myxococcota bacterium]